MDIVQVTKPTGDFNTVITHNICDKNTWEIGTADSSWTLAPAQGQKLTLHRSEAQFEHDIIYQTPPMRLK